jgi:hypothetical protein
VVQVFASSTLPALAKAHSSSQRIQRLGKATQGVLLGEFDQLPAQLWADSRQATGADGAALPRGTASGLATPRSVVSEALAELRVPAGPIAEGFDLHLPAALRRQRRPAGPEPEQASQSQQQEQRQQPAAGSGRPRWLQRLAMPSARTPARQQRQQLETQPGQPSLQGSSTTQQGPASPPGSSGSSTLQGRPSPPGSSQQWQPSPAPQAQAVDLRRSEAEAFPWLVGVAVAGPEEAELEAAEAAAEQAAAVATLAAAEAGALLPSLDELDDMDAGEHLDLHGPQALAAPQLPCLDELDAVESSGQHAPQALAGAPQAMLPAPWEARPQGPSALSSPRSGELASTAAAAAMEQRPAGQGGFFGRMAASLRRRRSSKTAAAAAGPARSCSDEAGSVLSGGQRSETGRAGAPGEAGPWSPTPSDAGSVQQHPALFSPGSGAAGVRSPAPSDSGSRQGEVRRPDQGGQPARAGFMQRLRSGRTARPSTGSAAEAQEPQQVRGGGCQPWWSGIGCCGEATAGEEGRALSARWSQWCVPASQQRTAAGQLGHVRHRGCRGCWPSHASCSG